VSVYWIIALPIDCWNIQCYNIKPFFDAWAFNTLGKIPLLYECASEAHTDIVEMLIYAHFSTPFLQNDPVERIDRTV
jgi:hypothetical protein